MDKRYVIGKLLQRGRALFVDNESLRDFQHSANLYLELDIDQDADNPFIGTVLSAPCISHDDTVICPVIIQDDGKHYILLREEVFKNAGEVDLSIGGINEDKIVVTSNMIKITISDSGSIKAAGTPPEIYWEIEVLNAMKAWYENVVNPTFDASNEKLNQLIRRTEEHEETAEELQLKVQEQQTAVDQSVASAAQATQTANAAATNANEKATAANTAAQAANKAKNDADTATSNANKAASDANAAASNANTKAGEAATAASEANAARDSASALAQIIQEKLENGEFNGRTMHNGIGDPPDALGKDGETYLNKSNEGEYPQWLYLKEGGKWIPLWRTQGEDGTDTVPVGAGYVISGDEIPAGYKEATPPFHNQSITINSDFRIWQRGTKITPTQPKQYIADRWRVRGSVIDQSTYEKYGDNNGMKITFKQAGRGCIVEQILEVDERKRDIIKQIGITGQLHCYRNDAGKIHYDIQLLDESQAVLLEKRATAVFSSGKVSHLATTISGNEVADIISQVKFYAVRLIVDNDTKTSTQVVFYWEKSEYGEIATTLIPKSDAEELMRCQRYGRYICVDYTINAASNSFSNMMSISGDMRTSPTLTLSVGGTMTNITGERITYSAFADHVLFSFAASASGIMRVYGRKYWADAEIY